MIGRPVVAHEPGSLSEVIIEALWRCALTLVPGRPSVIRPVSWGERPADMVPELVLEWITPPLWRRLFVWR